MIIISHIRKLWLFTVRVVGSDSSSQSSSSIRVISRAKYCFRPFEITYNLRINLNWAQGIAEFYKIRPFFSSVVQGAGGGWGRFGKF